MQLSLDCQEYAYVTYKEYQGLMTKFKQIKMMVIGIEIFGIYLISNILLLIGSIKKIKGLLITWTIYAVIGIALELVFAFKHEKPDKPTILVAIARNVFTVWAIIAVYGGMKEIDGQRRGPDSENTAMVERRPIQSSNRQRLPLNEEISVNISNEVDTQRAAEANPPPNQGPTSQVAGGVFVNRYGMTHADSEEDLILKHLI